MKIINGDVDLHEKNLRRMPKKPDGTWLFEDVDVRGNFSVTYNDLKSLEGSPKSVNHLYLFGNYKLESLEFIPYSRGTIDLSFLYELTSLEGFNQKRVNGSFKISGAKLGIMKGFPEYVGGDLDFVNCGIESLDYIPKEVRGNLDAKNNPGNFTEEQIRAVCKVHGRVYTNENW